MSTTIRWPLGAWGWSADIQSLWDARLEDIAPQLLGHAVPGRVTADFGMQLEVVSPRGLTRVDHRPQSRDELVPAVGDWVALDWPEGRAPRLLTTLPRRSGLVREAPGKVPLPQVVGANLDVVFVVCGLPHDFNARRVERYVAAARHGGVQPVVVLTKVDLVADVEPYLAELRQGDDSLPVCLTSRERPETLETLAPWLSPGSTVALVGSSGVGKSTLVNMLFGRARQSTGDIRARDGRGRHTTTHRELILHDSGVILVDTPGMREFQPWNPAQASEDGFEDIQTLAGKCRFGDCTHAREPGCAVREAIARGELSAERLGHFSKIRDGVDTRRRLPQRGRARR